MKPEKKIAIEQLRAAQAQVATCQATCDALGIESVAENPRVMNEPIPMFLTCPACCARHIDEGEFATKLHHTHSCQACGLTWRPAIVPTVGVQFLPGFGGRARKDALLFSRRTCTPLPGWWCSRPAQYEGPCAARPIDPEHRDAEIARYPREPGCTSNECEIRDTCTGSVRCPKNATPPVKED